MDGAPVVTDHTSVSVGEGPCSEDQSELGVSVVMEPSNCMKASVGTAGACGGKASSPGGAPSAAGARLSCGCWPAGRTGRTGGGAMVVGGRAAWASPVSVGSGVSPMAQPCRPATNCNMA